MRLTLLSRRTVGIFGALGMLAFHKIWDRLAEQFHLVAIDLAAGVQGPAGIAELIGFPVLPKAWYASGTKEGSE